MNNDTQNVLFVNNKFEGDDDLSSSRHPMALPRTEHNVGNCHDLFRNVLYCYSPAGAAKALYNYGEVLHCEGEVDTYMTCLDIKTTFGAATRQQMLNKFHKERDEEILAKRRRHIWEFRGKDEQPHEFKTFAP